MTQELKPCPFCGGAAKLFSAGANVAAAVNCMTCDSYGPSVLGKDAAIAAWNRRAASTRTASDTRTAAGEAEYDAALGQ